MKLIIFIAGMITGANIGLMVTSMLVKSKCKCILDLKEHEQKFIEWWRNHPNYRPTHITGPHWSMSGSVSGRAKLDKSNIESIEKENSNGKR